ncbi:MAG: xanthine phosphoribosyltransferase [Coriobacteriales bacterium]|nr:xanthine phosphoribosyltransferase [Coriobacteriales bacterium]
MQLLEDRIRTLGIVKDDKTILVDAFLNHRLDMELLNEMGRAWAKLFADKPINKILTCEAGGIALAVVAAQYMGGIPVVFARKTNLVNVDPTVYSTKILSSSTGKLTDIVVARKALGTGDRVLIIDDILGNGCAINGLIDICWDAGAVIEGITVAIEKGFQQGGASLRDRGYDVRSLCTIERLGAAGDIRFRGIIKRQLFKHPLAWVLVGARGTVSTDSKEDTNGGLHHRNGIHFRPAQDLARGTRRAVHQLRVHHGGRGIPG